MIVLYKKIKVISVQIKCGQDYFRIINVLKFMNYIVHVTYVNKSCINSDKV